MKFNEILMVFLFSSLTILGCASGPQSYAMSIESAILGGGWVTVQRKNGTVILNGVLEDHISEKSVLKAAMAGEGVTEVINYIFIDYD